MPLKQVPTKPSSHEQGEPKGEVSDEGGNEVLGNRSEESVMLEHRDGGHGPR